MVTILRNWFKYLVTAGAGRSVDRNGNLPGPWTPELLTEAILNIDANQTGIDLRTVQHWFQDNDKGISPDNINWLAQIFGCGDLDAALTWRLELAAANKRLSEMRKLNKANLQITSEGNLCSKFLIGMQIPSILSGPFTRQTSIY